MTKSESIKELATALCAFQASVEAISKDSVNPFFKSKYASLSTIIEETRDLLAKNGLSYAQFPTSSLGQTDGVRLATILMHSSGEWIADEFPVSPVDNKPQSVGSAITYARRYALQSILGLQVDDDDGNAASQPKVAPSAPQRATGASKPASVKDAEPKVVKEGKQKADIKKLCDTLSEVPLLSKEEYEEFVQKATGLKLAPENYGTIIERLRA
jgi:hypothetical protein